MVKLHEAAGERRGGRAHPPGDLPAIRAAIGAARVLARQRTGSQQMGVILFNRRSKVLLDLTDDDAGHWVRLMRAYTVLGETQKARAALAG